MKYKTTLLLSLASISLFAQNNSDLISDLSSQTGRSLYIRPNITDPTVQKHYISTQFKRAYVSGYEGNDKFRYNGMTDNFEFLSNDEVLNLVKSPLLKVTFTGNAGIFYYINYVNDKGVQRDRFVQAIIDEPSKYSLFKTFEVEEVVNDNINGYKSVEDKRVRIERNFIIGFENQNQQISKSTKKISQFLKINAEEIIKTNKLNLKKEEDVIKFIEILNK